MGTYIAVKPRKSDLVNLDRILDKGNILDRISNNELHVTLLYAPDHDIDYSARPNIPFNATVLDAKLMGEPGSKWEAIVLELHSPELQRRHNGIKLKYGNIHSYPDYKPHLSIKYQPKPDDLENLKELLPQLNGMRLVFLDEYAEELDGE